MAVRPIVLYKTNEAALRCKSEPVSLGSKRTRQLISDLKHTLLHHPKAIGLAAPQIGVHQRVVVVCFGVGIRERPSPPIAIVNPTIVEADRELLDYDGCLSIPGLYAETVRPVTVPVFPTRAFKGSTSTRIPSSGPSRALMRWWCTTR